MQGFVCGSAGIGGGIETEDFKTQDAREEVEGWSGHRGGGCKAEEEIRAGAVGAGSYGGRVDTLVRLANGWEKSDIRLGTFTSHWHAGETPTLLEGEPGVGKTGVVEGFAQLMADRSLPEELGKTRVIEISLPSLVAGTKYRGNSRSGWKR